MTMVLHGTTTTMDMEGCALLLTPGWLWVSLFWSLALWSSPLASGLPCASVWWNLAHVAIIIHHRYVIRTWSMYDFNSIQSNLGLPVVFMERKSFKTKKKTYWITQQTKLDILSNHRLQPPLVSDNFSLATNFPKYQKFQVKSPYLESLVGDHLAPSLPRSHTRRKMLISLLRETNMGVARASLDP